MVEEGREDRRAVEARPAQPIDGSVARDKGGGAAVTDQGIVGDGGPRWAGRGLRAAVDRYMPALPHVAARGPHPSSAFKSTASSPSCSAVTRTCCARSRRAGERSLKRLTESTARN